MVKSKEHKINKLPEGIAFPVILKHITTDLVVLFWEPKRGMIISGGRIGRIHSDFNISGFVLTNSSYTLEDD